MSCSEDPQSSTDEIINTSEGPPPRPEDRKSERSLERSTFRPKLLKFIESLRPYLSQHILKISLFALFISVATFTLSLYNTAVQNRRWKLLNQPRLTFQMRLLPAREISAEELARMNSNKEWLSNYVPLIYPFREDGLFTGKYRVYSELVLCNSKREVVAAPTNGMQTSGEVRMEAERLGLIIYSVEQAYRNQIIIHNEGPGEASNILVIIHSRLEPAGLNPDAKFVFDLGSNNNIVRDHLIWTTLDDRL